MKYNNTTYYYVLNQQGDVIRIVDENGTTKAEYIYDAWGNVIASTGTDSGIGAVNPLLYRGYYYDSELGMYYLRSRYYDPGVKRFINADSVEYLGESHNLVSYNMYTYCENNPVLGIDYTGNIVISMSVFYAGIASLTIASLFVYYIHQVGKTKRSVKGFKSWSAARGYKKIWSVPATVIETFILWAKSSKLSAKARSKDAPSWLFGKPPKKGEKAKDYAKRVMDEKYGKGNWKKGPASEYNKIVKYANRHLGLK